VFGWVRAQDETEPKSATPKARERVDGLRSRVRVSDALFFDASGVPLTLDEVPRTLPILSNPKPSAVRFYLMPQNLDLRRSTPGNDGGYDDENLVMRGRKFYRRGYLPPQVKERSNQNRTLRDVLPEGASATFDIHFENLAVVELGALLWAIELDHGWVHRLGFAKPMGYGDVAVTVEGMETWTGGDRWVTGGGFDKDAQGASATRSPRSHIDAPIRVYQQAMVRRYSDAQGKADEGSFLLLDNIADLRGLLATDPKLDVTYPLLPDQQGFLDEEVIAESPESYQWFVANSGRQYEGRRKGGHWLDLAAGDRGLPRDPTLE
jgi:CRISPR-associated protein (TIGR03986 family)